MCRASGAIDESKRPKRCLKPNLPIFWIVSFPFFDFTKEKQVMRRIAVMG